MATVHWDTAVTVEYARQTVNAPIYNVLIAISATKTPCVFNTQTAHRCVFVSQAMLETVLGKTVALRIQLTLVSRYAVEMVEHVLKMEHQLTVRVHQEPHNLSVTERKTLVPRIHV